MRRTVPLLALLVAMTAVSALFGAAVGSVDLPLASVFRALFEEGGDPTVHTIVWQLRLPRVALAYLVGGGLSIVGVAMQALVRNPLAEPYILGLSGGASAGASLFYLGFLPAVLTGALTLPISAFVGGLVTITIVYLVAHSGNELSVARLLLAGVAMSALMASLTAFVTFASPDPNRMRAVLFWLLGSLSGTRWSMLPVPAVVTVAGLVLLAGLSRPLDALLIGEEPAGSLGVAVERIKRVLVVFSALLTGTLVAYSGAIGFVGLIVPHAVRSVAGIGHRRVVPLAFAFGGIFLIWADLLARSLLSGQDLPVGIVTALTGVPFFLVLLRRRRYPFV